MSPLCPLVALLLLLLSFSAGEARGQDKHKHKVDRRRVKEGDPSFFDLEARDAGGKVIDFDRFYGYVSVVVNVPTECGPSTERNYRELFRLHEVLPYELQFVAFPSEGEEPEDCPVVEEFMADRGVNFLMMEPVHVNGPDTHPVYRYLKETFDMDEIKTDFGSFFIVSPEGHMEAHHDVTPYELKDVLLKKLKELEL